MQSEDLTMSKVKSFQLIMIVTIALCLLPLLAQTKIKDTGRVNGPDLITIDLPADISGNEMPAVDFPHAIHNQAVDGRCDQCHIRKDDETLFFAFQRTDQAPSMDLYHENCLSCHEEKKSAGKSSGPLAAECRSCHGAASEPADAEWKKLVFDKSLHYIHEKSENISSRAQSDTDNCSACHHEYNEKTKETFYTKGAESACVYCHKQTETDGIRSMQTAAHDACVGCHVRTAEKKLPAGPVTCYGCHDEQEQAKIKVVENIPRLKRNQPDAVFMTGLASEGESPGYLMTPVAFDHKGHEETAISCKVCHHESLESCSACHTPKGNVKGGFVRLEEAMHTTQSDSSCVGCHTRVTASSDCAGCHNMMPGKKPGENACVVCHNAPDNKVITDADQRKMMAGQIISGRPAEFTAVAVDKIPEIVTIAELADEYKPSEFPHRKVFLAIANRAQTSDLARAFHQDQQTLCLGCHHNSPKSLDPPKCASCHGKTTDIANNKPDLKSAYHGQCITCHQKMEIQTVLATDCIKCHEKK